MKPQEFPPELGAVYDAIFLGTKDLQAANDAADRAELLNELGLLVREGRVQLTDSADEGAKRVFDRLREIEQ
ncbi:hypothetical protein [Chitinolyticbacter meiyuanensis]|uniref:hypothetical protein n=1 Tax=Chitinolyticbacter meiyuanensis TaxID=682798 RepID=UPI0011E5D7BE|nr:hypothetical protein [Chitinolyticbacter meiyuanensis]